MSQKAFSRRSFIGGVAAAAAAGWVYESPSFGARTLRGALGDLQHDPVHIARADLSSWSDKTIDLCWVGHATVLVNFYGLHILTDPVLFDRVGMQIGIGTLGRKRLVAPALDPDALPRIDMVLLSHAHMDHMDIPSLGRMPKSAKVVTAADTADILTGLPFSKPAELRWGGSTTVKTVSGEVEVEAVEVKHWGARWKYDEHRGYVGYVLKRGGKTVLFGGDTAYTDSFGKLRNRKIDVAVMPIGSYGSRSGNHCTPEETVQMVNESGANYIVPIHHSTFPIGKEPLREPLERLENAIENERIAIKQIGQTWRLPV